MEDPILKEQKTSEFGMMMNQSMTAPGISGTLCMFTGLVNLGIFDVTTTMYDIIIQRSRVAASSFFTTTIELCGGTKRQ